MQVHRIPRILAAVHILKAGGNYIFVMEGRLGCVGIMGMPECMSPNESGADNNETMLD